MISSLFIGTDFSKFGSSVVICPKENKYTNEIQIVNNSFNCFISDCVSKLKFLRDHALKNCIKMIICSLFGVVSRLRRAKRKAPAFQIKLFQRSH